MVFRVMRPSSSYAAEGGYRRGPARQVLPAILLAIGMAAGGLLRVFAEDGPSPPDLAAARAGLAGKHRELVERIQKLNSLAPAGQTTGDQGGTTTELGRLRALEMICQEHMEALDDTAELQRELELRRGGSRPSSDTTVASAQRESWLVLEDYRDQLEAATCRARTCEHEINVAQDALQSALTRQDEAARTRRRLQDEVGSEHATVAPAEQDRQLRAAVLESKIADAAVDLRRAELERQRARHELIAWDCQVLEEKVIRLAARVSYTEEDLRKLLQVIVNYRAELETRLHEAGQRLAQLDAALASAAEQTKAPPDSAADDRVPAGASLETLRFARRLGQEEVEQLKRWLAELSAARNVPTSRYRLACNKATPDEIATWLANADRLMAMLDGEEQLLTARVAELMQDLTTLYRQSRFATQQDPSETADQQFRKAALERQLQVMQSGQLHVKMLRRGGQRFQQELRRHVPDPAGAPWWERARSAVTAAWSYELAAVGDRPITVGKVVKGLLGILCGVLAASFISRLLGKRILPRLGFNSGATEALRSLTFYVLSAVFGILSLELANVPLTALTFLGGAAAIAVGFASQDLVGNFISGVILLSEQPVRVGDLVELDGVKATVDRIGARSTRVRTDTNVEITVPHSKLLASNVKNLTLSDNRVCSSVTVSVDRSFPAAEIKACLLDAVTGHSRLVDDPPPFILFSDLGELQHTFEVHFSLAMQHITDGRRVESDLREAIDAALRASGFIQTTALRPAVPLGAELPAVSQGVARPVPRRKAA